MLKGTARIAVVAPANRLDPAVPPLVTEMAARRYGQAVEIVFHPQCFRSHGHFAGDDEARAAAFLEVANDARFGAVWFARGGYGSCRLLEAVKAGLGQAARAKTYLGYSDTGSLLGTLYGLGFPQIAHGPMPSDIARQGGEVAVVRALDFLAGRIDGTLEKSGPAGEKRVAFNLTTFGRLLGTPFVPDVSGHILLLEEVSEYMYSFDRSMFQLTTNPGVRKCAGIRLGRVSDVPRNDPDFGAGEEEVVEYWCRRSGIAYLGRCDIGHDADNKIVPFGAWPVSS